MSAYVLIETKNPLEGGAYAFDVGKQLRELNHDVTIYLLQDAVFTARKTFEAGTRLREDARAHGLQLLADDVSLRQRGVVGERVAGDVGISNVNELVDLLMERSDKAIWH